MGKSTISMAIIHSYVSYYHRVLDLVHNQIAICGLGLSQRRYSGREAIHFPQARGLQENMGNPSPHSNNKVGGLNPSEKQQSLRMTIPNIWKNKNGPNHRADKFNSMFTGSIRKRNPNHFKCRKEKNQYPLQVRIAKGSTNMSPLVLWDFFNTYHQYVNTPQSLVGMNYSNYNII